MSESSELPPAYIPPAYIASANSLDQPALGLVLAFAALLGLPQAMSMLVDICLLDRSSEPSMLGLAILMFALGCGELIAGVAIAWQWRSRRLWFWGYVACGIALVGLSFVVLRAEFVSRQVLVVLLETTGSPLLVAFAPRLFGVRQIDRANALGGLLIVSAVATLVREPLWVIDLFGSVIDSESSVGSWMGLAGHSAIGIAATVLQLVTGIKLARGAPARTWLIAYLVVALVASAGLQVASIIHFLVTSEAGETKKMVVGAQVTALVVSVARPLLIWLYARRERESVKRVGAALPWIALWFVPQLAARCLLSDELERVIGPSAWMIVGLAAAVAVMNMIAARATLRDESATRVWLISATIGAALFGTVAYLTLHTPNRFLLRADVALWPLALLFATSATAAWLGRRVSST